MKLIKYISLVLLSLYFISCEEQLETFSGVNRIQFSGEKGDSLLLTSFSFQISTKLTDTVYLKLRAIGHTSKKDRIISIVQIDEFEWIYTKDEEGNIIDSSYVEIPNPAKAGIHFLPLDDPELQKHYIVKANAVTTDIPIVLLRDSSLINGSVRLRLRVVENEYFELGEDDQLERIVEFSDRLEKPRRWGGFIERYYFGKYSRVKHKFMIDVLQVQIDGGWIERLMASRDIMMFMYYKDRLKVALKEYNEGRDTKDYLREEPKDGQIIGDLVTFP